MQKVYLVGFTILIHYDARSTKPEVGGKVLIPNNL
jgi:hypothetical protein